MALHINQARTHHFPWREGNRFEFLIDSTEFFPRMLDAIDAARQHILLEMYLVESGGVAERFINALLQAARRGVRVYLLFDDYGAAGLKQRDRDRLAQRNIQIVFYNPLRSHSTLYNLYHIYLRRMARSLYRDHRKLLMVDDMIAFAGGTGITDEFESPGEPESRWRETMIAIQGPVLADWQALFLQAWNRYAREPLALPAIAPVTFSDGQLGRVTDNEPYRRSVIQRSLTRRLRSAERRIWFATAYFIPSWPIRRNLQRAARAGVDVRLLLPGAITDHPGARHASHRYYGRLLKYGVRIFEYQPRFFHAKTVLCDNWVTVGSSNFDRWNLQWNLEANQEIEDQDMAATVQLMFETDFDDSVEYTCEEWQRRGALSRLLEWFWRRVELLSLKIRTRRRR